MFDVNAGGSAVTGCSGTGTGPRRMWRTSPIASAGVRVGRVDPAFVVSERAGHDRQLVAQVVEDEQHVGHQQRHVREPQRVRVRLAERLHRAHQVVAEEADRAAREGRQVAGGAAVAREALRHGR
jgi:hypothetical protein